jgi:hypothetical protein
MMNKKQNNISLTTVQKDMLKQLYETGPVWDGDVLSKSARDDLLELNLASRAIVKGEYGFTVANYNGGYWWDRYNGKG